jgi:hypothetical protein
MSVVDTVQQLCEVLVAGPVETLQVASSLGKVVEDDGAGGEVILSPTNRGFREIVITREEDVDEPYLIEFDLRKGADLRVAELRSVFGDFTKSPKVHWDRPAKIVFYVEPEDGPYSCAIIAQLKEKRAHFDRAVVEKLTVRRDVDID